MGEWWPLPKICSPANVTLFGKGVFADVIKNLEIKSSWITGTGSISNDYSSYKRQKKQKRRRPHEDRVEIGVIGPQPQKCWSLQKMEEARKDSLLGPFEGALPG